MRELKHLIVGLDLNPRTGELTAGSQTAVEAALWVATQSGARVDVVHSLKTDRYVDEQEAGYVFVHEGLSANGRTTLEGVVRRFAEAELAAQLLIHEERPWMSITKDILRHGADLVIVGRHDEVDGKGQLGSVAMQLIRKCPAPVWTVRPGTHVVPRRILAATDLTAVGGSAVEHAAYFAAQAHAELSVVHAFQIPLEDEFSPGSNCPDIEALTRRFREQTEEHVAALSLPCEPKLHVACTTPLRAIRAGVQALEPDLLVLGTISRGGLPGLLVGNTAEKILRKIDRSLLTVKPADFQSPIQA